MYIYTCGVDLKNIDCVFLLGLPQRVDSDVSIFLYIYLYIYNIYI